MEELQTDALSAFGKSQELDSSKNSGDSCAALLNGSDEIVDPLDLMDNCDNVSLGSNSDVWKASDSEDDNLENSSPKDKENGEKTDSAVISTEKADMEEDSGIKSAEDVESSSVMESQECVEPEDDATVSQVAKDKEATADEPECSKADEEQNTVESSSDKQPEQDSALMEFDAEKELDSLKEKEESTGKDKEAENEQDHSTEETAKESEEKPPEEPKTVSEAPDASATDKDPLTVDITDDTNPTEDKDPLSGDPVGESAELRPPNRYNEGVDDECQMDYDAEDDDDFDPSLLCPEVSMAVDDNPVVTTNGNMPNDGCDSPLPYEPVFSTFVDEVTGAEISFNLTSEEQELRRRLYGPINPIQIAKIHCTACNVHLGSALEGQNNRFVHPLLKVMICKECYHFYTSGEFEKDEDGSELYCRWCGQGGQVLCCSKCEYVFCKRCIRTNFGRKKMFEIRDSASWDCFRCNQPQIMTQRVSCYEFFEYVRREMQRAATLNTPEIWSTDHSRCCNQKKRAAESWEDSISRVKKPKKRKSETDPDYNPLKDKPLEGQSGLPPGATAAIPSTSNAQQIGGPSRGVMVGKPRVQLMPKMAKPKDNDIEFVRQIPAPHVTIGAAQRPTYRTILPTNVRPNMQSTMMRLNSQPPPLVHTNSNRLLNSALQGRNVNPSNMMKHEWFEKTVRAAARVNSHLSYTLTQLNKAQSQAASVEELAVVHNKLQEILSSSVNSLIQIRKNLRTEFIAGIKTVQLPSKKVDQSFSNDDDVIFVSAPTTMPVPSTSAVSAPAKDPLIIIDHSTPTKIHGVTVKSVTSAERPKGGYLKVKSVMELQNVPSECITIPDDSPTPPGKGGKNSTADSPVAVTCNGGSDTTPSKEVDPLAGTPGTGNSTDDAVIAATIDLSEVPSDTTTRNTKRRAAETNNKEGKTQAKQTVDNSKETTQNKVTDNNKEKTQSKVVDSEKEKTVDNNKEDKAQQIGNDTVYHMKEEPTTDIKRMMAVKVKIPKENLEELQRKLASRAE